MNDEQHQDISELRPQYQTYDRQKCFIAYSEQAYWSTDILSACEQVLSKPEFNLEPDYARKHLALDVPLRQKAIELIANARYGIYDLSCWRADNKSPWQMPRNVFIELGIAIALNRPTLLLRHASNKEAGLELPKCLQCLGEQILEFSGKHSLKTVLLEKLPKWVNTAPEQAWWNRNCIFGGRVCEHRETHPRAKLLGQNTLSCSIADGADTSRPDFREILEDVLGRFSDVTYTYLDALSLEKGYSFLLCTHCQKVRSSPFAIHRITLKTPPEAFIAIGMSLALETQFEYKIPNILITEDVQIVPSLLSGYEVVVAKSDKDKKNTLRQFMPAVINKVRETTWRREPLPFLEMLVPFSNLTEESEEEITNSEPESIQCAIDYTRLRNLLAAQNWKQADEETLAVMLKASGRQTEGWLDKTSIDNIPDTDLRIIDQLWVESSNGRFGFSVQREIYLEVGGQPGKYNSEVWNKFCHRVGWRVKEKSIDYSGVIFSTTAPVGHLPAKCCRKMPHSDRHSWSNRVVYQIARVNFHP
jgi:GUN4-like